MKNQLKRQLGAIVVRLFPAIALRVESGEPGNGMLFRLARFHMTQSAIDAQDWVGLRSQLAAYWQGGEGDEFYDAYPERFEEWFLGDHYRVIEELRKFCDANPDMFSELYEFGCGDGRVLHHMSEQFPDMAGFVGIDINSAIIKKNTQRYGETRLRFADGDAMAWLEANGHSHSVLMTYGGVLEYFTQGEVEAILKKMASLRPAAFLLVEPMGDDFDLESEHISRPYGEESSFSHNHRFLLEQAGFEIVHNSECHLDHRWQMLLGIVK
ncbi:MAG: putative TPR repeat methyltransferase [Verrucomicrobiales bacterium]|jgi:predicted TPR repeat methyltransferase